MLYVSCQFIISDAVCSKVHKDTVLHCIGKKVAYISYFSPIFVDGQKDICHPCIHAQFSQCNSLCVHYLILEYLHATFGKS